MRRTLLRGRCLIAALPLALALAGAPAARAAVQLDARWTARSIENGGTVALIVTVTDPKGLVQDPQFTLPSGLEQLGSVRSQQFSLVNGRGVTQVIFRYEIGATRLGRYTVGPIRASVGGQVYRTGELSLVVTGATPTPAAKAR